MIYGRRSVLEALRAERRKPQRLLLAEGSDESEALTEIKRIVAQKWLRIETRPRKALDELAQGANHQGVMLEASAYPYLDLDEVLDHARESGEPPFLLLLDLLQDVQNMGTLLRAAEAVGVHGVLIQERRAAGISPAVVNASSGAVEHLRVAQVTNLAQAMQQIKEADIWIAGLDTGDDSVRYDLAKLKGALALVVGAEGAGLRRLVRERCDFIINLPMRGHVESLNAATAGSIALYAAWQARGFQ